MKTFEGNLVAQNMKVALVAARFNEFITSKLIGGAMDGLTRHGVQEEDISLAWVPGAFEIPLIASKMAASGKYDAVICLGAVIRGSTSHYDYVCAEVSKGIAQVSLQSQVPVLFGVLTTDTIEQAIERAGTKAGNKGYDCALSAVEMVNLIREVEVYPALCMANAHPDGVRISSFCLIVRQTSAFPSPVGPPKQASLPLFVGALLPLEEEGGVDDHHHRPGVVNQGPHHRV